MRVSRKWIGGAAVAALALLAAPALRAADHQDGSNVKADPAADITDLYSWMDGSNVVLVMDVFPLATTTSSFSDSVQYVFHTVSMPSYGSATTTPVDIICTFDSSQNVSCWVGTTDYVTGNASATSGITSASGKVKVFTGLRDDAFFFNLGGFHDCEADVEAAASSLTLNAAGCPALNAATSAALVADISHSNHGAAAPVDFFAGDNVLSIVLSIDQSLLTSAGPIVSVWAATLQ